MVLETAAAATAAASTGGTLFSYNRENFLYDRKQRQETEYAILEFRLKQAELWREDVRDIIGLTSVKMDTYLIVTAVQLGFCVMAFCEGRLQAGTPTWLIGSHTLSLVGAFLYFLMSVWLAMHASISAKSYEVRLLTQLVRLPVPSWSQLEGARTYASQFEQTQGRQMFRVPFAMGSQESVMDASKSRQAPASGVTAAMRAQAAAAGVSLPEVEEAATEAVDPWGMERAGITIPELDSTTRADPRSLRHVQIVNEVVQYWQAYDGFARVSMSLGTNQLVTALAYYVLGYVLISNHSPVAAWSAVLLFIAVKLALIRLDMSLTACEFFTVLVLVAAGPSLAAIAAHQWSLHTDEGDFVAAVLAPLTYLMHSAWLLYLLYICGVAKQPGGAMLPTRFRSVLYMDVFGWIKRRPTPSAALDAVFNPSASATLGEPVAGEGPALQVTKYDRGTPLPARPEDLPSAQRPARTVGETKEHLDPSSFVPKPKGWNKKKEAEQVHFNPGNAPWRIFWWATATLALLWIVSGVFTTLSSLGFTFMQVYPLLREGFHDELASIEGPDIDTAEAHLMQLKSHKAKSGAASKWWDFSLLQRDQDELSDGQVHATKWPHANIRPLGLACDGAAGLAVAATRFGVVASALPNASSSSVQFSATSGCEALQGESLQDINLDCASTSNAGRCKALLLHRQGTRLTSCTLPTAQGFSTGLSNSSSMLQQDANSTVASQTSAIAADWLEFGGSAEAPTQQVHEEVSSVAYHSNCTGMEACLYLETTSGRIVELRQDGVGEKLWLPRHILHKEAGAGVRRQTAGGLHTLNDRYVAVLRSGSKSHHREERQFIEVLDPTRDAGIVVARWHLPRNQHWGSMCATGDSLFLLPTGASPQLWQFSMPQLDVDLDKSKSSGSNPAVEEQLAAAATEFEKAVLVQEASALGNSRLRHRQSRQQKLQVSAGPLPAMPW